jgi:hypothetical protein
MDMEVKNPAKDIPTLLLLDTLLRALGTRALILLTLAMTFGLAAWAMVRESPLHCAIAAGFCFGVLWPVLYIGWKSKE